MKSRLIALFLSIIALNSYSQKGTDVIIIGQTRDGGDGNYSMLIGENNISLSIVEDTLGLDKVFTTKYITDKNSLSLIRQFVLQNYEPFSKIDQYTSEYFFIRIISPKNKLVYYVKHKESMKSYIKRLINIINWPPYRKDCSKLIDEFNSILRSLEDTR
jgi:hypothetical protein